MSNDEIWREFLLETHENLALLDADLIRLEKHPSEKSTLAQVFRTLHSVKGTAGFMGLVKLQAIAHSAESLLSRLRAGELVFNAPIATALLQVVDAVRVILSQIEAHGGEGSGDYTARATTRLWRLSSIGCARVRRSARQTSRYQPSGSSLSPRQRANCHSSQHRSRPLRSSNPTFLPSNRARGSWSRRSWIGCLPRSRRRFRPWLTGRQCRPRRAVRYGPAQPTLLAAWVPHNQPRQHPPSPVRKPQQACLARRVWSQVQKPSAWTSQRAKRSFVRHPIGIPRRIPRLPIPHPMP